MERSLSSTHGQTRAGDAERFSLRRFGLVAGLDLAESVRRPLLLIWALLMALNGYWQSRGEWIFHSIDTSLGGTKAWADSEFQTAYIYGLIGFFLVSFFVAVAAGLPLIRDTERNVGALLHSTPLRPSEYVWGKFLAALAACLVAVAFMPLFTGIFSHLLPDPGQPDIYGSFHALSYVRPFLVFLVPATLFMAGACFAIGRFTGRPILVFLVPISLFLFFNQFVWHWFPPNLDPSVSALLRLLDPSGFRWLKENWLFVDRGIAFYNTRPVAYDTPFLLSRAAFGLLGLLLVDVSRRHFTGRLRRPARAVREPETVPAAIQAAPAAAKPLSTLGMGARTPGFLRGTLTVARFELAELRSQPGLYIFIPAILLFLLIVFRENYDDQLTPILLMPGNAATKGFIPLTLWLGLLLMFYMVESVERERTTGVAPVYYATPVPTSSVLAGKWAAHGVVTLVAIVASGVVPALVMVAEGKVGFSPRPFLLVWGLLLIPTLALWTAFIAAVVALTRSRYATYGIGLGAVILTVFALMRNHMSWVGNWPLITELRWSDMGAFEIDRAALVLNRLLALALAVLFAWIAVRAFARRERDRLHPAIAPGARRRTGWTAAALAVPPLALGIGLWFLVNQGFQGATVERRHKDYWRENLATWINQPLPYVTRVEMAIDLYPRERGLRASGFYDLQNRKDKDLDWFPVTGGIAWKDLAWTLDGRPWVPEDRHGLYVFRLPRPLAPGASVRLGFRYRGTVLPGVSKNGGAVDLGEFILPAGVLVTGRNPDFVPKIGFDPKIGVDEENRTEPRIYAPRWYEGVTDADLDRSAFIQRLRISAPAEYTINSTGIQTADVVKDGRRTVVWESDYPLRVFNIAAGRWQVKRGRNGTAVFYDRHHPYNVDTLVSALDGARQWYAQWFGPYPWKELRLNEFPNYAGYARGNATNIFFSEGAGFLNKRSPDSDPAFEVAAHESAHQWWGHILASGEGPGGIVLAEGAANFSTMMLVEQVRGLENRLGFATRIEARYGEARQPSTEKPLAETLSVAGRPGDETVVYDKGGWVLWMLMHQMGRAAFLDGARHFIEVYHKSPDHPVLQDFAAFMRPYAPDKAGFEDFVQQWFYQRVIPEYHLDDLRKRPLGGGVWELTVKVENAGTGRMPAEVAATRGPRFDGKGGLAPGYRDARTTVVLGAGEAKEVRIRCPFEPDRVVVDPDGYVLQLQRKAAAAKV
ncbi:MAG TPA: ABC transporter permease [Thermoanaerobaculia bacterium]|jgi:ABC-type transport system involved in multi-copper enzyme maturation permease subunit